VAANCRENFTQLEPFAGRTLSAPLLGRLVQATNRRLAELGPRIEARSRQGVPRDTHGDLRLEHVYWFPDRPAPEDLLIIDCIEFNDRFRWADPVADIAFLAMELEFYGTPELARVFTGAYFEASGDAVGEQLLPFYVAYRHVVRGKVRSFQSDDPRCDAARKAELAAHARAHFLPALGHLEVPGARPCLILMTGLPGTGKSTLARRLETGDGFTRVSTDRVRRELVAASPGGAGAGGAYTAEWTARTYATCLARAAAGLDEGRRVVVDGTLRTDEDRAPFLELAASARVPLVLFTCECEPDEVRRRLADRTGDESEADWAVYRKLAPSWTRPGRAFLGCHLPVSTTAGTAAAWGEVRRELADRGLAPPGWGRDAGVREAASAG
jgi:predicted kinase